MAHIFDLIYGGEQEEYARKLIQDQFPDVMLHDASDFIHEGRFSVSLDNADETEYVIRMMTIGLIDFSMIVQLMKMTKPQQYGECLKSAVAILQQRDMEKSNA